LPQLADPTTVATIAAPVVDGPIDAPPARRSLRHALGVMIVTSIIVGAGALAFALLAGSHTVTNLLDKLGG
ncbi:MAG: hypothetical protein ABI658_21885, partial [Acidimicrobiales bacterium]